MFLSMMEVVICHQDPIYFACAFSMLIFNLAQSMTFFMILRERLTEFRFDKTKVMSFSSRLIVIYLLLILIPLYCRFIISNFVCQCFKGSYE